MCHVKLLRIFLSYGHDSNAALVLLLQADLERRGHDVWIDKHQIKTGDHWRREITDGIVSSDQVLAFLSRHSVRVPGVCLDEINIALSVKGGSIGTVLVESERDVNVPVHVSHIQWLDMQDWKIWHEKGSPEWENWYQAKLANIVQFIESDANRRFAGEIETLKEYLKPIHAEARIAQLLAKGFEGRQWLFDAVETWQAQASNPSRLFWIVGSPGVGKSAFAAQLASTRGHSVIGALFCEWDKPDHRSAARIVRSLVFQLATRLPDYRKLLLTLPEIARLDDPHLPQKNESELFDYLLANPLRTVIHGHRHRQLLVIDGLDEAGQEGRNEFVEMLARNAPRLPDWIGIVVTSRPDFDVTSPLQALKPTLLDTGTAQNLDDLRSYLRRRLSDRLRGRADAESLLERILERSEGVFLYADQFCDDIEQGVLTLDRPDEFAQGLGGIFHQYFQRQFPDIHRFRETVRPVLRAILAAREPLPTDTLRQLFHWQDEDFRDVTRPLASLFPLTSRAGSEVIAPYHKVLADWLMDEAKAGPYFVSVQEGHRLLGEMAIARPAEQLPDYALKHGPHHLIEAGDSDRLASLVRTADFLSATASRFGTAVTLENSRNVARALADRGSRYWSDLLLCAELYCRFSEQLRSNPSILADLIERGESDQALRIIGRQPDAFFRGVLQFATAPLWEQAGQIDLARRLDREGRGAVLEKVSANGHAAAWCTPETKLLLSSLVSWEPRVLTFSALDKNSIEQSFQAAIHHADSTKGTHLPWLLQILMSFTSLRARFYSGSAMWIAVSLMLWLVVYGIVRFGKADFDQLPYWAPLLICGLFAWQFVYPFLIGMTESLLKRNERDFEQKILGAAAAIEQLPEADRQRQYAKHLQKFFSAPSKIPASAETVLAYWTVQRFDGLKTQSAPAAKLMADVSLYGGLPFFALAQCLKSFPGADISRIFETLLRTPLSQADYSRVLQMILATVEHTKDARLLVSCLENYRRLTDQELLRDQRKFLHCLPKALLGQAILASLEQKSPASAKGVGHRIVSLVSGFPYLEQSRFVVRSPGELALAVLLVTPYMLFFYTLLAIAMCLIVPLIVGTLLAGVPADAYFLSGHCQGKNPPQIRQLLARSLKGSDLSWQEFFSWGSWLSVPRWLLGVLSVRRMRETVVLQNILRGEAVEIDVSYTMFQRVLIWLSQFGSPSEVVFGVMDDRRLLEVAKRLKPPAMSDVSARPSFHQEHAYPETNIPSRFPVQGVPGPDEDAEQLRRVLPFQPTVLSLLASLLLSGAITLLWTALWRQIYLEDRTTWIEPYAIHACWLGCGVLVLWQYLYVLGRVPVLIPKLMDGLRQFHRLIHRWVGRAQESEYSKTSISLVTIAVWYEILGGIAMIVVLYNLAQAARTQAAAEGLSYPTSRSDTPYLDLAMIVILTSKAFVPWIISQWRGSNLLYPQTTRLWLNRLWCLVQLGAAVLFLAWLAHQRLT